MHTKTKNPNGGLTHKINMADQVNKEINFDECPPLPPQDKISEEMWKQLFVLNKTLADVRQQFSSVHADVYGENGLTDTVTKMGIVVNEVPSLKEDTVNMREELSLIKAVVIKQNEEIAELKKKD